MRDSFISPKPFLMGYIVSSSDLTSHQKHEFFLNVHFLANSIALFLRIRAETATSLVLTIRTHLKITWCKFASDPSLKRWHIELPPFLTASKNQRSFTCFSIKWISWSLVFHTFKQSLTWGCQLLLPSVRCIYL